MAKKMTKSKDESLKMDKELMDALNDVTKKYGANTVMSLDPKNVKRHPVISTGSILLDSKIGGGYPKGKITEIYGPEASGKTTFTLHAAVECQRQGGRVLFVDAEHALDIKYAMQIGLDVSQNKALIAQPGSGEEALEIADRFIGAVDLIIIDSVAALTPRAELEGEMGDAHMALQARLMSQALRKMTSKLNQTSTTMIFINQLRAKIGGFSPTGVPQTTTGGNALKYYATLRLQIGGGKILLKSPEGDVLEKSAKTWIKKNKVAPLASEAELVIGHSKGFVQEPEILTMAYKRKLITSGSGHHYYYGEDFDLESENIFTPEGADNMKILGVHTTKDKKKSKFATNGAQAADFLKANPKFTAYLKTKLLDMIEKNEVIDVAKAEMDDPVEEK